MYCFYCTTHAPFHQSLSCRRERYPDRYCERYPDQRAQEKPGCKRIRVFFGGRGWLRTTEALSSRFTVCPHWPLGNTPLFGFDRLAAVRTAPDDLFILPQAARFVKRLFRAFLTFFSAAWRALRAGGAGQGLPGRTACLLYHPGRVLSMGILPLVFLGAVLYNNGSGGPAAGPVKTVKEVYCNP